ncbi:MAG: GNAT family N-acetyltransferase [Clostridiales bacterium]|nr:GNAT family N-acetyltransferase [Clostridiales bacterium]
MNKNEFDRIKCKCTSLSYTSMKYTGYQDIKDYIIVEENDYIILLFGYNVEQKMNEYHYAASDVYDLLKHIDKHKALLSFIPKEWVEILKDNEFELYAKWNDFVNRKLSIDETITYDILPVEKSDEASLVTLSCKDMSRGFSGQTTEWMTKWINGSLESLSSARDSNVLYIQEDNQLVGIVCVAVYAHDSEKGPILWIREIAVKNDYQNLGYGKSLIKMAIQYGLDKGAVRGFLAADETNEHAIKLYNQFGFISNEDEQQIDMIRVC